MNRKNIKLKILAGGHLTAAERKAAKAMLQNRWATAHNKPGTKSYRITNLTEENFDLETGTKAVRTTGDTAKWRYSRYKIAYKQGHTGKTCKIAE